MVICEICKMSMKKYKKGYGKKCVPCSIKNFDKEKQIRLRTEKEG